MREKKNTERLTNNNDNYCIGKKQTTTFSWQFEQGLATYERVQCGNNEEMVKSIG